MSKTNPDFENRTVAESAATARGLTENPSFVVPVLREDIEISKRSVVTGIVRLKKVVHQREELIDLPLMSNEIKIERTSVNRIVEGPIPVRYEGDTAVYSVIEEIVVTTKQFVLKEEVRITSRISETHQPQIISLRTEELLVEREATAKPNQQV